MRKTATSPSHHSQTARRIKKRRKIDADEAKSIDLCYLCERPGPALDGELCVAELAVAGVGRWKPLLQAALVHRAQSACAVARRQQSLTARSFVANTADGTITETKDNTYKNELLAKCSENTISVRPVTWNTGISMIPIRWFHYFQGLLNSLFCLGRFLTEWNDPR